MPSGVLFGAHPTFNISTLGIDLVFDRKATCSCAQNEVTTNMVFTGNIEKPESEWARKRMWFQYPFMALLQRITWSVDKLLTVLKFQRFLDLPHELPCNVCEQHFFDNTIFMFFKNWPALRLTESFTKAKIRKEDMRLSLPKLCFVSRVPRKSYLLARLKLIKLDLLARHIRLCVAWCCCSRSLQNETW
jgi:hypothetical protein